MCLRQRRRWLVSDPGMQMLWMSRLKGMQRQGHLQATCSICISHNIGRLQMSS